MARCSAGRTRKDDTITAERDGQTIRVTTSRPMRVLIRANDAMTGGTGQAAAQDKSLLERVVAHKKVFFRDAKAKYDEAKKGTLRLSPSDERLAEWEKDYEDMREMFFEDPRSFKDILTTVRKFESEFNAAPTDDKPEREPSQPASERAA